LYGSSSDSLDNFKRILKFKFLPLRFLLKPYGNRLILT
jgi:hypothetical protein